MIVNECVRCTQHYKSAYAKAINDALTEIRVIKYWINTAWIVGEDGGHKALEKLEITLNELLEKNWK